MSLALIARLRGLGAQSCTCGQEYPASADHDPTCRYRIAKEAADALGTARAGLLTVLELITASRGVAGLHPNGEIAYWHELRTGGDSETWLKDFDAALRELGASS